MRVLQPCFGSGIIPCARDGVNDWSGSLRPPVANGGDDLGRSVFPDEMPGAGQDDGRMVGQRCFEVLSLRGAEGDVAIPPHDQGRLPGEPRQRRRAGGEEIALADDAARKDVVGIRRSGVGSGRR